MLFKPGPHDLKLIGFYLGKVASGLSLMMVLPAVIAIVLGEWNSATALLAGAGIALALGQLAEWRLATRATLNWSHGMVVVALA